MGTMQERITTTKKGSITSVQVRQSRRMKPRTILGPWLFFPHVNFIHCITGHLCTCWWLDWSCSCHNLCSLGCYHCVVPCHRWAWHLPCCGPSGFHLPYHGPQHCRSRALWCCSWCTENSSGKPHLSGCSLKICMPLNCTPFLFVLCRRITNHCKTSLPSWVWMNCPRRTSWLLHVLARSSDSCRSPSRLPRSSLAIWESWCHLRKQSKALKVF